MSCFAENLKVLIWLGSEGMPNLTLEEYMVHVAKCCGIENSRLKEILADVSNLKSVEEDALREHFEEDCSDLSAIKYRFLFQSVIEDRKEEIKKKNIQFFINKLAHGGKTAFADKYGINKTTVGRWSKGEASPHDDNLKNIADYFGITDVSSLSSELYFLNIEQVTNTDKKEMCKEMIDRMNQDEFVEIYPGLLKLLK